jgi:predicted nucleotidyltransferase component of viral defense system
VPSAADQPVSDREAREAFHTLLLSHLRGRTPLSQWRVKGGVNLRLFFESVRYSEDMDLDAEPKARLALRGTIQNYLGDIKTRRRLASLGIRDVLASNRPAKDTETTLRFKLRLEVGGGVQLPTKVEISFRERARDDAIVEEAASPRIVRQYLTSTEMPLVLPHYDRTAAIRQKISALAGRAEVQARDVFDLALLCTSGEDFDLRLLARNVDGSVLRNAHDRVFELGDDAYESQVLEFLDELDREANADKWEEYQLIAAMLIESIVELRK